MRLFVGVTNIITGVTFQKYSSSLAESNAWVAEMIALGAKGDGWGWGPRVIYKEDLDGKPVTLDSSLTPLIIEETSDYWSLKAEYEYDDPPIDQTADETAEQTELDDYNDTIQQMKAAVTIIDGWSTLNDINITFLKKFFKAIIADMKERTTLN